MAKPDDDAAERAADAQLANMVVETEQEIHRSAFDKEEPENDGDRTREDMEDPLGGDTDEDQGSDDVEASAAEEEPEGVEPEGEAEPERAPLVPSTRLREEADRARQAERELAELRGRYEELQRQARPPQPPQPPQPPPEIPDQWAQPEEFNRYQQRQTLDAFRQELFQRSAMEARRTYGAEAFDYAVRLLDSDPRFASERDQILSSFNPGETVMRLAEPHMGPFHEQNVGKVQEIAERYGYTLVPKDTARPSSNRPPTQPRPMVPSLNGAAGGGGPRQRLDPRGMDGSEEAVFRDAFTPLR